MGLSMLVGVAFLAGVTRTDVERLLGRVFGYSKIDLHAENFEFESPYYLEGQEHQKNN